MGVGQTPPQVCLQGVWLGRAQAGGTHPTGMLSGSVFLQKEATQRSTRIHVQKANSHRTTKRQMVKENNYEALLFSTYLRTQVYLLYDLETSIGEKFSQLVNVSVTAVSVTKSLKLDIVNDENVARRV